MEMKVNNRSDRYDIIRPMPRHEHKYSKYKKSLSNMMLICITQHLVMPQFVIIALICNTCPNL